MKRKILLGVLLAVFLVSLMGMSAQAGVWKIKEVKLEEYGLTITVKYPDFKEMKEFSAEEGFSFRVYLTLNFESLNVLPDELLFTIGDWDLFRGEGDFDDFEKGSMFRPTKLLIVSEDKVKIEGYIEIIPVNLAETLRIVKAMKGFDSLYLRIGWVKYGSKRSFMTQFVELN